MTTIRVTITGEYDVNAQTYEGWPDITDQEIAEVEQNRYNDGSYNLGDLLEWTKDNPVNVVIEAVEEK